LTRLWKAALDSSKAKALLLSFLVVDIVFVTLHFLHLKGFVIGDAFSLEKDRGYSEFFQYAKLLLIVVLLFSLLMKTRVAGYALWSLLFFYLLLDDAYSLHEVLGEQVASGLAYVPAFGLRAQDFGELTVSAFVAVIFLIPIALLCKRGIEEFRQVSMHLVALLIALAVFGILVDMLHVAIDMGWKITFLLGVAEDGGEMLVISIMACYAFLLNDSDGDVGKLMFGEAAEPREQPA
jgi:hypothetical protein